MLLRAVLVIALAAAQAGAQPVDSFGALAELIESGRSVVVITSPDGAVITGRLVDISSVSLTVFADGRRIEAPGRPLRHGDSGCVPERPADDGVVSRRRPGSPAFRLERRRGPVQHPGRQP